METDPRVVPCPMCSLSTGHRPGCPRFGEPHVERERLTPGQIVAIYVGRPDRLPPDVPCYCWKDPASARRALTYGLPHRLGEKGCWLGEE
jgi:hypothetical protein